MHRLLITLLTSLTLAASAQAHFVWIERDAAGAPAAFFGEWAHDVRETQDGYLKLIAAPKAFASDGTELTVDIQNDRLAIDAKDVSGDIRLANDYFPEKGKNLTRYQAKLGRTETAAAARFDLELVPVSANANTFTLLLRGQPVADEDVTLFTSAGWNRTWETDAAGKVTIETPWAGQAIIEVGHIDKTPGEYDGRAYEAIRHVHTVTFDVPAK
jgi:hypothetical protein